MFRVIISFYFCLYIHFGIQICQEEYTHSGIRVRWGKSIPANNVRSEPLCYNNDNLITRNCVGSEWQPPASELRPCLQLINYYNLSGCPPGFDKISISNNAYCYQIKKPSAWNYPCLKSGGASVITDLSDDDVTSLLNSLKIKNVSHLFWLPARRTQFFSPIVWWHIPGPKWGHPIETNNMLKIQTTKFKNCLLLDTQQQLLVTETCSDSHPSLCFYINNIHYPAKCPPNYHSVRYMPDEGVCLGIEESTTNLTFNGFIENKICNASMGDKNDELTRFIFKKIAEMTNLPRDTWCWFDSFHLSKYISVNLSLPEIFISINNDGSLAVQTPDTRLSCMACLTEVIYKETELLFEYNEEKKVMYLTVYYPSGLWKYSEYDRGIQCFSNVKGFAKVLHINDLPLIKVIPYNNNLTFDSVSVDKVVYEIDIITDRAAQYWCEGHTANFSLIKSDILVVNPQGDDVHVFSLTINVFFRIDDVENDDHFLVLVSELCVNLTNIFKAEKVFPMEYLNYTSNYLKLRLHMHIAVDNVYEDNTRNIVRVYNATLYIAETKLPVYNYILLNFASSLYCLPTTSIDKSNVLNWELTNIGHIAAPKQFCLQENGLPVKRLCNGSYISGSFWGNVEGNCNYNYQPSDTTTFLYKFVKGQVTAKNTSSFLTDGLNFVLRDVDIIIPADIYYLSMSLQHILSIVQRNETSIDLGSIDNIAWVMDRVMVLNNNYLRLAQTLNSTNVILDSLNNIIEMLAHKDWNISQYTGPNTDYQLAIQPQFILQISYPLINNISGLAVVKTLTDSDLFTSMEIRPLFKNTSLEEILSIDNLEIATWIPEEILNSVKNISEENYENGTSKSNMHVIISVFHNDAIFQELESNKYFVNSRVIGVSLPGFLNNFIRPIPLVYRELNMTVSEKYCGFWNFQPHSIGNVPGYWSNSGCYLRKSVRGLTVCECDHLTHFGQLLNLGRTRNKINSAIYKHARSLNIISLVGSFLSLLGIMGIWITATVFHTWRKKASTKVLLHLSSSIALPLIFMIVFNLDNTVFVKVDDVFVVADDLQAVCISLGALLHFSVLASFMWMLIAAVLQFIRYVRVLGVYRPSRFMIKFTLVGWGTPLIPVMVVLALDKENYIPKESSLGDSNLICYPSGFYLIVTVVVPICIILAINITLFVLVIYAISKGPDGKMRRADIDLIGAQLRLSIFLFFLLGLTWIFGVLSFSSNPLWSYLFCLTSAMQGFVLFVYFIVCDAQTRNLWITLMRPQFQTESSRKSVSSISCN